MGRMPASAIKTAIFELGSLKREKALATFEIHDQLLMHCAYKLSGK